MNLSLDSFSMIPLLCPSTVIVGFKRSHYKVKESEWCVEVCVELLAGQLKPPDSVSFRINAIAGTAFRKYIKISTTSDYPFHGARLQHRQ